MFVKRKNVKTETVALRDGHVFDAIRERVVADRSEPRSLEGDYEFFTRSSER